jgi:hypothetical protein
MSTRNLLCLLFSATLFGPSSSPGLGWDPAIVTNPTQPVDIECTAGIRVTGKPVLFGWRFVGEALSVDARLVKIQILNRGCGTVYFPLPDGAWVWELRAPAGSGAAIPSSAALQTAIRLDEPGSYTVRFTPCPDGCSPAPGFALPPQAPIEVPFETTIRPAVETLPTLPRMDSTQPTVFEYDDVRIKCRDDGDSVSRPAVTEPQWIVATPPNAPPGWGGPDDYAIGKRMAQRLGIPGHESQDAFEVRALEGLVRESMIAGFDNRLNHDSQDRTFDVVVDPSFRALLADYADYPAKESIHNEWEWESLPNEFTPGAGDRISMFGFWIHDCGHVPFRTEIHPPVGIAVHRPRAIRLPDDPFVIEGLGAPVGTNVYVPGIVTDVWFSRTAGKITKPHRRTGLHQPWRERLDVVYQCLADGAEYQLPCNDGREPGAMLLGELEAWEEVCGFPYSERTNSQSFCSSEDDHSALDHLTTHDGQNPIDAPAPWNRIFSFNVYLPRSPKAVLEEAGIVGLPDVPLYWRILESSIPAERISVERREQPANDGSTATYLQVRVNLLQYPVFDPQSFRMAAGWVYPSEDNWGLRALRLRIESLHVIDDADRSIWRGEGEWNLWVQLANASSELGPREWTRIVNFDVDSGQSYDFGGRPWSTGEEAPPDRHLGPDLLLFDPFNFPEQRIVFHASGYELDDWFDAQEQLGLIHRLVAQDVDGFLATNQGSCFRAEGNLLNEAGCGFYNLSVTVENRGAVPSSALSSAAMALIHAYEAPEVIACEPGIPDPDGGPGPPGECKSLLPPRTVMPAAWHPEDVRIEEPLAIEDTRLFEPQEKEERLFMWASPADIYADIVELEQTDRGGLARFMEELQEGVASDLVTQPENLLGIRALRAALPAELWARYFGHFPQPKPLSDSTRRKMTGAGHLPGAGGPVKFTLELACDPIRNSRLDVRWENRRFELDLIARLFCEEFPEPLQTHRGVGIGRLDGVAGAEVEWSFADAGEPGLLDRALLRIRDGVGEIVLEVAGTIKAANLQAHADPKEGAQP